MKKLLFIISLLLCTFVNSQIDTFTYTQNFSNVVPADFTSTTPNGWNFTNSGISNSGICVCGSRSAKLIKTNSTKYVYIRLHVQNDYTYILSVWSRNICKLDLAANETPNQISLLTSDQSDIKSCKGSAWKESVLVYNSTYDGDMYFQISVNNFGEDDVYLDDITITETPPVSLPITLLYFRGHNIGDYNKITWSTASESNNDYFLIDKTTDGSYFTPVSKVNGAGNSSNQLYYEINDYVVFNGILYYRLKQVDINGEETIYDLISIDNRLKASPILNKVTNMLGQVVTGKQTGIILLFHYNDGTVIKRYFTE